MGSLDAGLKKPNQPRQHDTRDAPHPTSFKQPLRIPGQPDVMISIESSPDRLQPRSRALENYTSLAETVGTNAYGAVDGRGICEQSFELNAARKTSNRSAKRGRRHKFLSPPTFKRRESKNKKIVKEQESRRNQKTCLQNMEDLLECVLDWQIPKKQTPGNVKKSGMVGDKQQTMEAFYILSDVLLRYAISPFEPRTGETSIHAVAREAKHQIQVHLHGKSAIALPTKSLMADAESSGGPLCMITPDHAPCLPDRNSDCINCRKQRRRKAYEDNLQKVAGKALQSVVCCSEPQHTLRRIQVNANNTSSL